MNTLKIVAIPNKAYPGCRRKTILTFTIPETYIKMIFELDPCHNSWEEIQKLLQGDDYYYRDCGLEIIQKAENQMTTFRLNGNGANGSSVFQIEVGFELCSEALRTWAYASRIDIDHCVLEKELK
jgi:hypothetical protein